jgi:peptide/nickel transport system permease protein
VTSPTRGSIRASGSADLTGAAASLGDVAIVRRRAQAGIWSDALWRLRHDPTTLAALAVFATLVVLGAGADLLASNVFHVGYQQQDLLNQYHKPTLDSPVWWFGTDQLGRSIAVRLLYGGRVSLAVGTLGALEAVGIGLMVGLTAGYFRGWWDDVVVWLITTIIGIPQLFLLLTVSFYFRLDPPALTLFLGGLVWLGVANLTRGQTFSLREREFVVAARSIGASPARIMLRHILPNVLPLIVVVAMIDVATIILAESALSYLGFGIQPPVPSWGNMLSGATQHLSRGPWLVYAPGVAITLTVLCLYLIGDGLRDALDPRLPGNR